MLERFILPDWFEASNSIKNELLRFWNKSYSEIYEEKYFDKSTLVRGELEPDILTMLELLNDANLDLSSRRLIYFNWALCLAAKRNIESQSIDTSEYQSMLNELMNWEASKYTMELSFANYSFLQEKIPGVIAEAVFTFKNMIMIPDAENITPIVEDSIDCCLQGSGICHGAVDKRAIFNWLLLDVFPSAYYCRLPNFIYTIEFDIENWIYYKQV